MLRKQFFQKKSAQLKVAVPGRMPRFELNDIQWEQIQDLLPGRIESVGRTALNNRTFVDGILWVLRSGACWHDLPERYGKYKSLHKRFSRLAANDVWEKTFDKLLRDRKNHCLMVDSTVVRAHQQASTARKSGGQDKALGRSRGGLTTKIHLLADDLGLPVDFTVTAGQVSDCTQAIVLLGGSKNRPGQGAPKRGGYALATHLVMKPALPEAVPARRQILMCGEEKNPIIATRQAPAGLVVDLLMKAERELAAFYTAVVQGTGQRKRGGPLTTGSKSGDDELALRRSSPELAPCFNRGRRLPFLESH